MNNGMCSRILRDAASRGGSREIYHLIRLIGPKLIVEPIEVAMGGFRCMSKRLSLSRVSDFDWRTHS